MSKKILQWIKYRPVTLALAIVFFIICAPGIAWSNMPLFIPGYLVGVYIISLLEKLMWKAIEYLVGDVWKK